MEVVRAIMGNVSSFLFFRFVEDSRAAQQQVAVNLFWIFFVSRVSVVLDSQQFFMFSIPCSFRLCCTFSGYIHCLCSPSSIFFFWNFNLSSKFRIFIVKFFFFFFCSSFCVNDMLHMCNKPTILWQKAVTHLEIELTQFHTIKKNENITNCHNVDGIIKLFDNIHQGQFIYKDMLSFTLLLFHFTVRQQARGNKVLCICFHFGCIWDRDGDKRHYGCHSEPKFVSATFFNIS